MTAKVNRADNVFLGKSGKNSIRLANCKAMLGKVSEGKAFFNAMLQDTKGKAYTKGGKSIGTGRCLGAIADGSYKGKGKVVLGKGADGNDRIDYHVQLLDPKSDTINWSDVTPVGCISSR